MLEDKLTGEKMSENVQDMVRSQGAEVAINEPPCVLWRANHENCDGCKYELGCGKTVHILLLMMTPMMYEPASFSDHQAMQNRIIELTDMTMEAKTVGDLKLVPHI